MTELGPTRAPVQRRNRTVCDPACEMVGDAIAPSASQTIETVHGRAASESRHSNFQAFSFLAKYRYTPTVRKLIKTAIRFHAITGREWINNP